MSANTPSKSSNVMSYVFILFVAGAVLFAAFSFEPVGEDSKTRMEMVSAASFDAAKGAVTLAIGLIGVMALWLGMFRILEVGGLLTAVAKRLKPLLSRLFPDVPPEHPAMGAMIMNMSSNLLGLGNAATPFGLKAMQELDKLNPFKGTATNAMIMFLAINTSNIALMPLGVIGLRASAGSSDPASIFLPSLLATSCSTVVAVFMALFLAKRDKAYRQLYAQKREEQLKSMLAEDNSGSDAAAGVEEVDNSKFLMPAGKTSKVVAVVFIMALLVALVYRFVEFGSIGSAWLMPSLMLLIISYACYNGIKIYETVVEGAKQGFEIAVRIIPFLVVILVAVAMFRASGAMDLCVAALSPITGLIGLPPEVLPMAIIRPLSGTGAFSFMSSVTYADPDSYNAFLAAVLNGSTETTFYVLAVYFGSVGIVRIRHAVLAALTSDIAGVIFSCIFAKMFF